MLTYVALVSGAAGFVAGVISTTVVFCQYERKRK